MQIIKIKNHDKNQKYKKPHTKIQKMKIKNHDKNQKYKNKMKIV